MSTKHTPGDWAVVAIDERRYIMVSRADSPSTGVAIATECNATGSAANMNLMAAAPELLEALQSVKTYLEDCLCDRQQIGLPSRTAYDRVCAAIAKATAE